MGRHVAVGHIAVFRLEQHLAGRVHQHAAERVVAMRMRLGATAKASRRPVSSLDLAFMRASLPEGLTVCHHCPMQSVADSIDRLTTAIGRGVSWLALAIVLGQFTLVVTRYVFGFGSIWLTETVMYAHAALFMLAAAWTLRIGGHVRVDVFYAEASPRTRAKVDLAGHCCCCCLSRWC